MFTQDLESLGVVPRAVRLIFDALEATCEEFTVKVAFFEILNEKIYDLLNANNMKVPLKLKEEGHGKRTILKEEAHYLFYYVL